MLLHLLISWISMCCQCIFCRSSTLCCSYSMSWFDFCNWVSYRCAEDTQYANMFILCLSMFQHAVELFPPIKRTSPTSRSSPFLLLTLPTTFSKYSISSLANYFQKKIWGIGNSLLKYSCDTLAFPSTKDILNENTWCFQSFVAQLSSKDKGECMELLWTATWWWNLKWL